MKKIFILALSLVPIFSLMGKSESVIISEFLANPSGKDKGNEWIELQNLSTKSINLKNWFIEDKSGKIDKIKKDTWISAKSFLLIKPLKNITINNSGEELTLYNQKGEKIFKISYSGRAKEGESFARDSQGEWHWVKDPTPARRNIIEKETQPKAEKIFPESTQADLIQAKPAIFKLMVIAMSTSLILAIVSAISLNKLYK